MTQPFDSNNRTSPAPTIPGQSRQPLANRDNRPVLRTRKFALIVLCFLSCLSIVGFTTWASTAWFNATGRALLASPLGQIAPPRTIHASGSAEQVTLRSALGDLVAQEGLTLPFDPDTGHVRFDIVPWTNASAAPVQGCHGIIRTTCTTGLIVANAWVSVQWNGALDASADQMRTMTKTLMTRWQAQAQLASPLIRPQ